jgi:hypothetical protein
MADFGTNAGAYGFNLGSTTTAPTASTGLSGLLGGLLGAGMQYDALEGGIERAKAIPEQLLTAAGNIASEVGNIAEFKPFTVTSGAGRASFDPATGLSLSTSPVQGQLQGQAQQMAGNIQGLGTGFGGLQESALRGAEGALGTDTGAFASGLGGMYASMGEQQIAQAAAPSNLQALQSQFAQQGMTGAAGSLGGLTGQLQQAASGALGGATPTAQSVYEQIRAMQSPEEERQRQALENRLAAQGRLGVSTAAYGGTPEQLAFEKAQAEARNQASLQALQTADQLATSQQSRAAQLAQLGMSAEQIDSQLASEGLARQAQSAGLAGQLAQTGAGIEAQQQQLGQGLLGLGLQAQQLGGALNQQDVAQAQTLANIAQQTAALPTTLQGQQIQNVANMLTASGIPQSQLLDTLRYGLGAEELAQAGQFAQAETLGTLGQQSLAAIPNALETEAMLRAAQQEALINALGIGTNAATGLLGSAASALEGTDVGNFLDDYLGLDPSGKGLFSIFG